MQEHIPQDELDRLIARWNRIHRDLKVVPTVWGLLFVIFVVPLLLSLPQMRGRDLHLCVSLTIYLSTILLCILGGTHWQWRIGYARLLPKMLAFDDLRLVPCLIQATTPQHKKHLGKTLERLSQYLNTMTVDNSALLTEKEYGLLHRYLLDLPIDTTDTVKNSSTFRLAILRLIKTMGHTPSITVIRQLLETYHTAIWKHDCFVQSAKDCLDTLLEIQEQVKHDTTLLRASQQAATPDTLLRAAMPSIPNSSNLLTPTEKPPRSKKNEI